MHATAASMLQKKFDPDDRRTMRFGVMTLTSMLVSPRLASEWLKKNQCNRRLRPGYVRQYAEDMQADRWEKIPCALCFDTDGNLGNGQHTLNAIIESGVTQELLVATNVPRNSIAFMDVGAKRSISDIAHFVGENIETRRAAIARIIEFGIDSYATQRSFSQLFDAYQNHVDAIEYVCALTGGKNAGITAVTLAVCAMASYTVETSKIERFIQVMKSGLADGLSESSAIRLRDIARDKGGRNDTLARREMYRKANSALLHFVEGRSITKLYGIDEDVWRDRMNEKLNQKAK
jgi:hypothetical protein